MKRAVAGILVVITLLLTACANQTVLGATQTATISNFVSPPQSSPTPLRVTPKPQPSVTLTPIPSLTPIPTEVFSPIDTFEPTLISPDGKWTAYFAEFYNTHIRVTNADETVFWEISEPELDGREVALKPFRWSHDNHYLYFTLWFSVDGYLPFFYNGAGIKRLDVTTGKISEILPRESFSDGPMKLTAFAISPDDKQLAYITFVDEQLRLIIRNLTTHRERRLWLKGYLSAGNILWSSNQNQLVLALVTGDDWDSKRIGLAQVNVNGLSYTMLIQDEERVLIPVAWIADNEMLLRERGGDVFFLFDLNTKQIQNGPTVTPFP